MKNVSLINPVKVFICIVILAVLITPSAGKLFKFDLQAGMNEKRRLLTFHDMNFSNFWTIPYEFDRYFIDNFGFRGHLIQTANTIRYYLFRDSPTDKVMIGKDNWLFYSSRDDGNIIEDYKKNNLDSYADLRILADRLVKRRDELKDIGSEYIILLVPNKASIYPEYLPDRLQHYTGESRYDRLVQYLTQNTDLNIVALKRPLLEAKGELDLPLYDRRGTHWNPAGAFVGYRSLALKMKQLFPNIRPRQWSDYTIIYDKQDRELEIMLGVFFSREYYGPHLVLKEGTEKFEFPSFKDSFFRKEYFSPEYIPKGIIFMDSFFVDLGPYVAGHFQEAQFYWSLWFNMKVVKSERPSLVVQEVAERYLEYLFR